MRVERHRPAAQLPSSRLQAVAGGAPSGQSLGLPFGVRIAPLVNVAVALHYGFLVFLVVGGFLALRWRRVIWLHVGAALWSVGILAVGQPCPLTALEDWARGGSSGGFIDRHVSGVLYPNAWEGAVQGVVATVVLTSWALLARQRTARSWSNSCGLG